MTDRPALADRPALRADSRSFREAREGEWRWLEEILTRAEKRSVRALSDEELLALPILYRGRLVGRLDPSFDRKTGLLTLKSLHWEDGVRPHDAMLRAVAGAVGELTTFLGGDPDRWMLNGHADATLPAVTIPTKP